MQLRSDFASLNPFFTTSNKSIELLEANRKFAAILKSAYPNTIARSIQIHSMAASIIAMPHLKR